MNMNKALQHLYKAISGQDTTKVNISKLLVDIHYAATGVECAVKNNWAKIIDSIATNWTGGGGGGGGSSDFSTAQVTITNNSADDYLEFTLCYGITDVVRGNTIETSIKLDNGESITVDAILYKGNYATIYPMQNLVCTGGITYTNGILNFTGNGTITMN